MYVSPKNIQLVAETNQALSHIMTLYLEEGDYVIAEEPVVPDNASIFRNKGINLVTVPMEPDGMDLAKLETRSENTRRSSSIPCQTITILRAL